MNGHDLEGELHCTPLVSPLGDILLVNMFFMQKTPSMEENEGDEGLIHKRRNKRHILSRLGYAIQIRFKL